MNTASLKLAPIANAEKPRWLSATAFPFTSRFMEVDNAQMHYIDEGAGDAILLLHGTPMWSFMYRHTITTLRTRYRVIAVDLPGFGRSLAPLHPGQAFSQNAAWLTRFVERLGLSDFSLCVHATAGPSALRMALEHRRALRSLIISNTFAWPLDVSPKLSRIVRVVSSRVFGMLNVRFNLLPRIAARFARRGGFAPAERAAILGPFERIETRRHLANILYSLTAERDFLKELDGELSALAKTPTLLLYGAQDNGYKAGFMDRWRSILSEHPNNRAVVLERAGHFCAEDAPDRFSAAIRAHLDQRSSRRGG